MNWELIMVILSWIIFSVSMIQIILSLIIWHWAMTELERMMSTFSSSKQYILATISGVILYVYYLT